MREQQTRIRKDPSGGWFIEVRVGGDYYEWILKRWTAGTKRDALKAEAEVVRELKEQSQ